MILYLDTSALVTLYVEESGTPGVIARVEQAGAVTTARVTYAEARAAFARHRRQGALSPAGLRQAVRQLDEDWLAYTIVDIGDSVVREAGTLAERHALRGYDAVQLGGRRRRAASRGRCRVRDPRRSARRRRPPGEAADPRERDPRPASSAHGQGNARPVRPAPRGPGTRRRRSRPGRLAPWRIPRPGTHRPSQVRAPGSGSASRRPRSTARNSPSLRSRVTAKSTRKAAQALARRPGGGGGSTLP